jgi:hypothetical protein
MGLYDQHKGAQLSLGVTYDFPLHIDHIVKISSTIGDNLSLDMLTAKVNQTTLYFSTSQYIPKRFSIRPNKFFHIFFIIKVINKGIT